MLNNCNNIIIIIIITIIRFQGSNAKVTHYISFLGLP